MSNSKFVCMRCGNNYNDNGVNHGYWGDLCICCTYDVTDPYKKLSQGSCNIRNCKNCGGPEARANSSETPSGELVIGDKRDEELYLWKHKGGRTFITRASHTYEVPSEIFDKLLIEEPTGKARITIRKEHTKKVTT